MHSTYMKPHIKLKRVNIIISHISSLAIYSYMYMIHIQGASCTFSNGMGHWIFFLNSTTGLHFQFTAYIVYTFFLIYVCADEKCIFLLPSYRCATAHDGKHNIYITICGLPTVMPRARDEEKKNYIAMDSTHTHTHTPRCRTTTI